MNAALGGPLVSIPSGRVDARGRARAAGRNPLVSRRSPMAVVRDQHSPRTRYVAQELRRSGLATLLLDLLTPQEDRDYEMRFDIELLTERLGDAVRFARAHALTQSLPVGLFGASTGAASALRVAAAMPDT